MFTADNYSNTGIEYDYDALNEILRDLTEGSEFPEQDEKNMSDHINNNLHTENWLIKYKNIIVGKEI